MRFDNRVAIVTGGGRGLGRAHCLELARRGARVVVNDPGVTMEGVDTSENVADQVVNEILAEGGEAVANIDSVASEQGSASIVKSAIDSFGRVDVLVHNAGIVTFSPIESMPYENFRKLLSVHVDGAFLMARAMWPYMKAQQYGRLIFITSQAAISGLPDLSHYAVAKVGLTGLSRALSIEGETYGIRSNSLGVAAYTRMMANNFQQEVSDKPGTTVMDTRLEAWWKKNMRPELVAPAVAYLAHEDCVLTGEILDACGGQVVHQFLATTKGFTDIDLTAEKVRDNIDQILDQEDYNVFKHASEFSKMRTEKILKAGADPIVSQE